MKTQSSSVLDTYLYGESNRSTIPTFRALAILSKLSRVGEYFSIIILLIVDFGIPVMFDSCRTDTFFSYITGRILENYFRMLGNGYSRDLNQKIFDLIIYFKYYLPSKEYKQFILELKNMLEDLQARIHPHAFEYVRGQMGIKDINDLNVLIRLPKDEIDYNKFDKTE